MSRSKRGREFHPTGKLPRLAASLLAAGLLLPLLAVPAGAATANWQCVNNLQAPLHPGNSCTANDVTFILVGLGDQSDGCVDANDTLTILLGAKLQNTSGQTRYDIGMFIYNYLGAGDPTPDAYGGQQCAVERLTPVGTVGASTCPPLDLSGGAGPFYNDEGNGCGDLVKGMCGGVDVLMKFTSPVTVKCRDTTGPGGTGSADGFADIATCATWGNSSGQVGPGGVCNSETHLEPGTGSKCRCETVNSDVPVARLAPSCACSPTPVRPGQSTACTVSFTNTVPNCSATVPGTPERFQCGTASFVRFKVGYNAAQGQVLSSSPATPNETTGGTVVVDGGSSQVVWTPRNTTLSGTSSGIIGPNESGSMTYQFLVAPGTPNGTINQTVTTFWSNTGPAAWTGEVAQATTATCSFVVSNNATFARVSSFTAEEEDGRVVVAWETAAELGTRAFELERRDPASGRFERVAEGPVPAVGQLPGGRYRLTDPTAPRGATLTYRLVEVDQQGAREVFGPFRVEVAAAARPGGDREGEERGRDFSARPKAVSERLARAALAREAGRSATASAAKGGGPSSVASTPATRLKVEVTRTGLYRVRTAQIASGLGLSAADVASRLRAGRLRLYRGGRDAAWQPAADGDGLTFYGEAIESPYTTVNVYWLEPGKGQALATVAAQPPTGAAATAFAERLHVETDAIPAVSAPLPVEDFWIWKSFFPGFPGFDRATFRVDVPAPAPTSGGAAALTVNLYGFAASQRAALRLNGTEIGELQWSGSGPAAVTLALPPGVLADGANTVEIVALEASLGFWLDSFDLAYPRLYRAVGDRISFRAEAGRAVALGGFRATDVAVYDVAQPLAPRRLGGLSVQPQTDGSWGVAFLAPGAGPYLAVAGAGALYGATVKGSAPAELLAPERGAEYLVITPAELRAGAQRLAGLRAAQGLASLVVDLDDVMDLFADGVYDPAAIRRFLAHATSSWPTPPRYVALAGKGTYDYRNLLGLSSNLLPPLLVATAEGLAPADAEYADLQGGGVPAVAVGRIPAVTPAEMNAYVDKLAAYESGAGGAWTSQALLLADGADMGGDFPAASEALAGVLAPGLALSRVYVPASPGPAEVAAGRSALREALRQGQVLVNYVGHGGLDRIDSEGMLVTADVAGLGNAPRLPVMTALTCLIAQFAYPQVTSLGEELVLRRDGGAIALYGPTWLAHNGPSTELGRFLLPELSAPGGGRLGDRLLRGLAAHVAAGGDRQTLRLYTLLGDPALAVKR